MPFDGNGGFDLVAGNPVVTGTTISSTVNNNTMSDFATGFETALTINGQTTPTANIPMGGFRITGLGNATAVTDAARVSQVQNGSYMLLTSVGGTANAITATATPTPSAITTGQIFRFFPTATNTGATTIAISGLTAFPIRLNGSALASSMLPINRPVEIMADTSASCMHVLTGILHPTAITVLTTGSGTYTTPSGASRLWVRIVGGGAGGGGATANNGTAGNNTTFGGVLTAGGGAAGGGNGGAGGAGGTAAGGDINIPGGSGQSGITSATAGVGLGGGVGGSSAFGGGGASTYAGGGNGATNSGGGGAGGGGAGGTNSGGGGGAGGYVEKTFIAPAATYVYDVGAAANGGSAGGNAGGNGAAGIIIIYAYFD